MKKIHNSQTLSNPRIKEIVNFLAEQKNISEVSPNLVYSLARKFIGDSMISSQNNDGTNKQCDIYLLNTSINKLLNALKVDNKYAINNDFLSCLEYCKSHLIETPYFFENAMKTFFREGLND